MGLCSTIVKLVRQLRRPTHAGRLRLRAFERDDRTEGAERKKLRVRRVPLLPAVGASQRCGIWYRPDNASPELPRADLRSTVTHS